MLDISIENVILPNKPLNNFELENAAKRLLLLEEFFFLLDTLPRKPNENNAV